MQEPTQDGAPEAEVVTIPLTVDDELSDIPAEMRDTVAKEIAAFRDRSNRRDLERLRREEEIEAQERARNQQPRTSRLASPPPTSSIGPTNATTNGAGKAVPNAPLGPKGFTGSALPRDYQGNPAFVNGTTTAPAPEEDADNTDASDDELERRRAARRRACRA